MLTMEFDYEKLADALAPKLVEQLKEDLNDSSPLNNLPPLLTRTELMKLLRIGPTKAAELMARPDFPVLREAGVLIPTHKLFEWIDRNTRWVKDNTKYFKAI